MGQHSHEHLPRLCWELRSTDQSDEKWSLSLRGSRHVNNRHDLRRCWQKVFEKGAGRAGLQEDSPGGAGMEAMRAATAAMGGRPDWGWRGGGYRGIRPSPFLYRWDTD